MKELGITRGCSGTAFCPDEPLTRWMAAVLVVRAKMLRVFGENFSFPQTPYFTDVPGSDAGFSYVQKFRELGYTSGCSETEFCGSSTLTREQAAIFLTRAFFN